MDHDNERYIEYEDIKKKESTKALDTCNTMCAGDQKEHFWNENGEQYIGVVDFKFHF